MFKTGLSFLLVVFLLSACVEFSPHPPYVSAGEDRYVEVNQTITLTGVATPHDDKTVIANVYWLNDKGATLRETASFNYTPTIVGTDVLTFKAENNWGISAVDSVNIIIVAKSASNKAPIAHNKSVTIKEDSPKNITLNATDMNNDVLSYRKMTNPQHGDISFNGNIVTYTPTPNYHGDDSFTYVAKDATLDSNIATVFINITSDNDGPKADAGNDASVLQGQTVVLNGSGTDIETASNALDYSWSPATNLSQANIAKPTFTANSIGSFTYTLTVTDGNGATDTDDVIIEVLDSATSPKNVQTVPGDKKVTLTWDAVIGADRYHICMATETIVNHINCTNYQGGLTLLGPVGGGTSRVVQSLTNGTKYFFTIMAANGGGNMGIASAVVNATPYLNQAPTANAGDDVSIIEGLTTILQGSGSDTETASTDLIYSWSPTTNLSQANIAKPTFTANSIGSFTYTLTVTDGNGATDTDDVIIEVLDSATSPKNVQTVPGDKKVTLTWDAVIGADRYHICMATETIVNHINCTNYQGGLTLLGPVGGGTSRVVQSLTNGTKYFFTIMAANGGGNMGIASAVVNATPYLNQAPTANAGDDVSIIEGLTTILQGSGSDTETASTDLIYSWSPTTDLSAANVAQPTFTALSVSTNTDINYTLTVTDADGAFATSKVTVSILNLPAQPQNVQAAPSYEKVTLSWDAVSDATKYDICLATETILNPAQCSNYSDWTEIANISSNEKIIKNLNSGTTYYFVVVPKNANGRGPTSAVASTSTLTPVSLNDTGIALCGDYDASGMHSNSDINCNATQDDNNDPIPAGQDGHFGRDNTHNNDADGHAGFSFTKISSSGTELAASAGSWSCIKDNITNLIWEVKTNNGLHNTNDSYAWYNTNTATNGGNAGAPNAGSCTGFDTNDTSTYCNTQALVARVNQAGYCGASDWRMPTREELHSIADKSQVNPVIDVDYFPNTQSADYWSSMPAANNYLNAWGVSFSSGKDSLNAKIGDYSIRLVRSGQ